MYGRVLGVAVIGVQGHVVRVEAHVGRGLPTLALAGLPGAGVLDGRERVRPAVESAGLEWPLRRVVVNLSPANVRKEGPGFDLPIAMGVLVAGGQVGPDGCRGAGGKRARGAAGGGARRDPGPHADRGSWVPARVVATRPPA